MFALVKRLVNSSAISYPKTARFTTSTRLVDIDRDTVVGMMKTSTKPQLYAKLGQIAVATNADRHDKEQTSKWIEVINYIHANPPTTLKEAHECLHWSHRMNVELKIESDLDKINLSGSSEEDLLSVYYYMGYADMFQVWIRLRDELMASILSKSKNGILLSSNDLYLILELRYHHLKTMKFRYLDTKAPKLIYDSLSSVLSKPDRQPPERLSYFVMYTCSLEYQTLLLHEKARALMKLVNIIARDQKKRIESMSHREMCNYVGAGMFVNSTNKMSELIVEIQHYLNNIELTREHQKLCLGLLSFEYKYSISSRKSLLSSQFVTKICLFAAKNLPMMTMTDAGNLIRIFKHYSSILRETSVPKLVASYCTELYDYDQSVCLTGFEYALLNEQNIKSSLVAIMNNKAIDDHHKQTRLMLLASRLDHSTFINYIQDKEALTKQRFETMPFKIAHSLRETLLEGTEQYNKISRLLLHDICQDKLQRFSDNKQLFRIFLYITRGPEEINKVLALLRKKQFFKTSEMRKRMVGAIVKQYPNETYSQDKLRLIHGIITGLNVPSYEFSNVLAENRFLVCSFFSYGADEKKMFYELLNTQTPIRVLTKLYWILVTTRLDGAEELKNIITKHPEIAKFKDVFRIIVANK